ncbi:MAG: hypothetical protein OXI55_00570 [Gammaproteobacteria bacterium]|nr:hypothetical protein [Gammaproteobacteria bacterium]
MAATTFTIFSDEVIPGWAEGFARLLSEESQATVGVVSSLEAALDSRTDVLVLALGRRFDARPSDHQIARLGNRRIIAMSTAADWLRRQVGALETRTGMSSGRDHPMISTNSELLGNQASNLPFHAFKKRYETPLAEFNDLTPMLHFGPTRLTEFRPDIEYIVTLAEPAECAVVMRQASVVYAGVHAHPDEFSAEYRQLIRRVALALATRPVEPLAPIVVNRQMHPPGTVRFELSRWEGSNDDNMRTFHFRFEQPTVLTATLEHTDSDAMMLLFSGDGGTGRLHWTRVDSEAGETLTIAANINQQAIESLGHRYWELQVVNFDRDKGGTAKLTVRYDTPGSDARLAPLAGDDGLETLNWRAHALLLAARDGDEDALARIRRHAPAARIEQAPMRHVVAREHGFGDWPALSAHVAWELPNTLPSALAFGTRLTFERGLARYPDSFSAAQLGELFDGFPEPVASLLGAAFTQAKERGHQHFTTEHLLEVLIDNPISQHVLHSVGCDIDALRPELGALLEALPATTFDGETQVSEPFCSATYRADFIPALGREGMNPGSLLAGLMGEDCHAQKLLAKQGIRQQDLVNYVCHGIPTSLAGPAAPGASVLDPQLEAVVQRAFASAKASHHEFLTTEHLTAALLSESDVADAVRSMGADVDDFARDVADHVDSTPRSDEPGDTQPTRAFNEIMQVALALAKREGRDQASPRDAFDAILREPDLPTCHLLAGAMEGPTPSRPKGRL